MDTVPEAKSKIGEVCLAAFKRILQDCVRFRAAELYFLRLKLAALSEEGKAREAHDELSKELLPDYLSPGDYFIEHSFVMLVASFEYFLQELLFTIVSAYPKKVGRVEFKLSEILDAGNFDELVRRGIESTLNALMYKRPAEYLNGVADLLSIDPQPFRENWDVFVEAKARRDLGVHNGWRCNEIYRRKTFETGAHVAYANGERLFPPPDGYLEKVRAALIGLADALMETVFKKHGQTIVLPVK